MRARSYRRKHPAPPGEKVCRKCGLKKSLGEFQPNPKVLGGRIHVCYRCRADYALARRRGEQADLIRRGRIADPPRDGDKKQAAKRTAARVRNGELPRQRDVPCTDCGHLGEDRRHEYDHYLGYEADHHDDVEVVCKPCHTSRELARGKPIGRPRKSC